MEIMEERSLEQGRTNQSRQKPGVEVPKKPTQEVGVKRVPLTFSIPNTASPYQEVLDGRKGTRSSPLRIKGSRS